LESGKSVRRTGRSGQGSSGLRALAEKGGKGKKNKKVGEKRKGSEGERGLDLVQGELGQELLSSMVAPLIPLEFGKFGGIKGRRGSRRTLFQLEKAIRETNCSRSSSPMIGGRRGLCNLRKLGAGAGEKKLQVQEPLSGGAVEGVFLNGIRGKTKGNSGGDGE